MIHNKKVSLLLAVFPLLCLILICNQIIAAEEQRNNLPEENSNLHKLKEPNMPGKVDKTDEEWMRLRLSFRKIRYWSASPHRFIDLSTLRIEFLIEKGQKTFYTYDFGDNWEHEIEIVDILKKEKEIRYPKYLNGRRSGPPENCGGIPGYEDVIDALTGKSKSECEDLLECLGDYDSEKFDIDKINKAILDPGKYLE